MREGLQSLYLVDKKCGGVRFDVGIDLDCMSSQATGVCRCMSSIVRDHHNRHFKDGSKFFCTLHMISSQTNFSHPCIHSST